MNDTDSQKLDQIIDKLDKMQMTLAIVATQMRNLQEEATERKRQSDEQPPRQ